MNLDRLGSADLRLAFRLSEHIEPGKLPQRKSNSGLLNELLSRQQFRFVKVHLLEPQKAAETGIVIFSTHKDQQVFKFSQEQDEDDISSIMCSGQGMIAVSTFTLGVTHRETVTVSDAAATRSWPFACSVFRVSPASGSQDVWKVIVS